MTVNSDLRSSTASLEQTYEIQSQQNDDVPVIIEATQLSPSMPLVSHPELMKANLLRLENIRKTIPPVPVDMHSNAEPHNAVTTSMNLKIHDINWEEKCFSGEVEYQYTNLLEDNGFIVLDTTSLDVSEVTVNGMPVKYEIKETATYKPHALRISIPDKKGEGVIGIKYTTNPDAKGLFWVDKNATDGKTHDILFTQAEEVDGASWLPGQHSPQVRMTWNVSIETGNKDLLPVISSQNNPAVTKDDGKYTNMKMDTKVPLYLLGIAVGPFAYHAYNGHCGIYAEQCHIDDVAERMKQIPEFLEETGNLFGRPYVNDWKTYTPVLLPFSYPYGAMEHACATFFGGDCIVRPNVWIHEIAHAWAGNITTNATWLEFFFNEGLTSYVESRVTELCLGKDAAAELIYSRRKISDSSIETFIKSGDDSKCKLIIPFNEKQSQISSVPYGKGLLFFKMLEETIGIETWDKILKDYIQVFAQDSICEDRFLYFLEQEVKHYGITHDFESWADEIHLAQWLHGVEMPDNTPTVHSKSIEETEVLMSKFLAGEDVSEQLKTLSVQRLILLLTTLKGKCDDKQAAMLDNICNITSTCSEWKELRLIGSWSLVCAKSGYLTDETAPLIRDFVIRRNSRTYAQWICGDLKNEEVCGARGKEVVADILEKGKGVLFPLTLSVIN
jgi:leukotriene-A4 hydrolase